MSWYERTLLPALTAWVMHSRTLRPFRQRVVAQAAGRVLEIGLGAGENLPHYGAGVVAYAGLDPSLPLLRRAQAQAGRCPFPVLLVQGDGERLPFPDASFDAVLHTWTLCSIPDPQRALAEFRRVLRPGGVLHFVEHGLAAGPGVQWWQRRLTPLWRRVAGGCHLDRDIGALVRGAGFALERLEAGNAVPGPRVMSYFYEGRAEG